MTKSLIKSLLILAICLFFLPVFSCERNNDETSALRITIYYSDNATLPFRHDWLTIQTAQEMFNVRINWEIIPISDFGTKVSLALNTGVNTPDVILYQSIAGENVSLAMNGAIVPISDYSEWTPHWNSWVEKFGLEYEVGKLKLQDGKRYSLPRLYDKPFYDGGLILREDILELYGLPAPKTFDDLHNILRLYKRDNPSSFPLTILAGPRVFYRMTQPSWGISVHRNGAGGSRVLSWDYENEIFFPGAISEQYRDYMHFMNRLFAEGLLDPEMSDPISGDNWSRKMATGYSIATYAYYDQIGGITAATRIPGFRLQMYPPLEGPAGAFHQQKDKTGPGVIFPTATSRRRDFERVVRTIDKMFFSEEAVRLWCLGVEGITYTMDGDTVVFSQSIQDSPDGVYKIMQLRYGAGSDITQMIWINEKEMLKYDENYAQINKVVAAMDNAIQAIPPIPRFDDINAERATSLIAPLFDTFTVWDNAFLTGTRSLDIHWDAYVAEMTQKGIFDLLNLYNSFK
jgi:putative aldouronate transport system substrate-binding protein